MRIDGEARLAVDGDVGAGSMDPVEILRLDQD
jgi:hypothetical protein